MSFSHAWIGFLVAMNSNKNTPEMIICKKKQKKNPTQTITREGHNAALTSGIPQ